MKFLWTTIYVKDLEKSISFYEDLLELKIVQRFPAGPKREIVFLGNGTSDETLVELLWDAEKNTSMIGDSISIGFAVESMDKMLEITKSKGFQVCEGPFETPKFRFFCVKDPNGLSVQFFETK